MEDDKVKLNVDKPVKAYSPYVLAGAALVGLLIALIPVSVVAGVTLRGTWSSCGLPDLSTAYGGKSSASCYHVAMDAAYDEDLARHIQAGTFPGVVDKFMQNCETNLNISAAGCAHLRKVTESMASPSAFQKMCMNGPAPATYGRQLQSYGDDSHSCSRGSYLKCARGVRRGTMGCVDGAAETYGLSCVAGAAYAGYQCRCQIEQAYDDYQQISDDSNYYSG